jgi:hypothetical protein
MGAFGEDLWANFKIAIYTPQSPPLNSAAALGLSAYIGYTNAQFIITAVGLDYATGLGVQLGRVAEAQILSITVGGPHDWSGVTKAAAGLLVTGAALAELFAIGRW